MSSSEATSPPGLWGDVAGCAAEVVGSLAAWAGVTGELAAGVTAGAGVGDAVAGVADPVAGWAAVACGAVLSERRAIGACGGVLVPIGSSAMIFRMEARISSMLGSGAFSTLDIGATPSPRVLGATLMARPRLQFAYNEARPISIELHTAG